MKGYRLMCLTGPVISRSSSDLISFVKITGIDPDPDKKRFRKRDGYLRPDEVLSDRHPSPADGTEYNEKNWWVYADTFEMSCWGRSFLMTDHPGKSFLQKNIVSNL